MSCHLDWSDASHANSAVAILSGVARTILRRKSKPHDKPRRVSSAKAIPLPKRVDVRREEFNRVIALLNERGEILNDLRHNQDVQFRRLAQLQAELDLLKREIERILSRS